MGKKESKCAENGQVKGDSPITVVLKVEMHCEGCAQKVRHSVKGFQGVEAVASDIVGSKLTVIGKVNPIELRTSLESKTHMKVDLISPSPAASKEKNSSKTECPKPDKAKDQEKLEVKKRIEPVETTAVLKVGLHCDGCVRQIRKHINKIKGVNSIAIDIEKDLVTVKGTMDVNSLPAILTAKMKRVVQIVNQKKDGGDGEKEKSEKKKKAGGGAAKEEEKVAAAASTPVTAPVTAKVDGNKTEYNGDSYGNGNGNYPYRFDMAHAPEFFSDENPNACSVM